MCVGGQVPEETTADAYGGPSPMIGAAERNKPFRANVLANQAAAEESRAQSDPTDFLKPTKLAFDVLDIALSGPARERVANRLQTGGTPVVNEKGRTIGAVYRNRLGMKEYTGQPDYNPIASRVEAATTGLANYRAMESVGGVFRPTSVPTAPVTAGDDFLRTGSGGIVQARTQPTTEPTPDEQPPEPTPVVKAPEEQLVGQTASLTPTTAGRGLGRRRAFGTRRSLLNYRNVV